MTPYLQRYYALARSGQATAQRMRELYDEWAHDYENELSDECYEGAMNLAHVAGRAAAHKPIDWRAAPLLDVACGTGLVGKTLAETGFGVIDGVDLSLGMLRRARDKNVYRYLVQADLTSPLPVRESAYLLVTCAGVFSQSCLGPQYLGRLLPPLAPRGEAFALVNQRSYTAQNYDSTLNELVRNAAITRYTTERVSYWASKGELAIALRMFRG